MPTAFKIRQVEFVLTFVPERPFVSMLDVPKTVGAIFDAFGDFGVRAADVRFDSRGPSLGDAHFQVWLFNSKTLVTVRLDSIEVWIGSDQVPASAPSLAGAAARLAGLLGAAGITRKQIATRFHGELEGITVAEWFESKLGIRGDGQWRSDGASFESSAEGGVKGSAVLERSRVVEDGLFLSVVLSAGGDLPDSEAAEKAQGMFKQFISVVDLAAVQA